MELQKKNGVTSLWVNLSLNKPYTDVFSWACEKNIFKKNKQK